MEEANQPWTHVLIYTFLVVVAIIAFAALVKGWLRRTTFNAAREDWEDSPEVKAGFAMIETLGNPQLQEMVRLITTAQGNYELPWQAELIGELTAADASMRNPFTPPWDHESFRAYADAMKVATRVGDRSLFNKARFMRMMLQDSYGHSERLQEVRDAINQVGQ